MISFKINYRYKSHIKFYFLFFISKFLAIQIIVILSQNSKRNIKNYFQLFEKNFLLNFENNLMNKINTNSSI